MIKGPEIRIARNGYANRFGLQVWIEEFIDRGLGKFMVAEPLTMKEQEIFTTDSHPTLAISSESGQQLIDDLWQAGLRPSEGTGSAGALAAVEKHLADMRTIAFNRLKIGVEK